MSTPPQLRIHGPQQTLQQRAAHMHDKPAVFAGAADGVYHAVPAMIEDVARKLDMPYRAQL
jgi:hypothetical protein